MILTFDEMLVLLLIFTAGISSLCAIGTVITDFLMKQGAKNGPVAND